MGVHRLSVDSLRRRQRAVLHGQKHARHEFLQADGERRPRMNCRVRRQLAGDKANVFAKVRQVVLDEMLGDEVAGSGDASTFCWERVRVYPTSSVNHVRLTPLRTNSWSHQQGEVWARPGAWAATSYPIGQHNNHSGWSVQTGHESGSVRTFSALEAAFGRRPGCGRALPVLPSPTVQAVHHGSDGGGPTVRTNYFGCAHLQDALVQAGVPTPRLPALNGADRGFPARHRPRRRQPRRNSVAER